MDTLAGPFRFVSLESDIKWFENYAKERGKDLRLAICKGIDECHIGNVYLLGVDPVQRTAEFHIFIGERSERGKGYGANATLLCLKHGFMDMNLHRIELNVLTTNRRAIGMYEGCGFTHEGTGREAVFKNGKYLDVCRMAILADEFSSRLIDERAVHHRGTEGK